MRLNLYIFVCLQYNINMSTMAADQREEAKVGEIEEGEQ
jgi:hypothetical protein